MKPLSSVRRTPRRIGLAPGSGSARGWSHIGAIRVLEQAGAIAAFMTGLMPNG